MKKTMFVGFAAATLLFAVSPVVASADNTDTNTTAHTEVGLKIDGGDLFLNNLSAGKTNATNVLNFDAKSIKQVAEGATFADQAVNFGVTDETGTDADWNISAAFTGLKSGENVLGSTVSVAGTELTANATPVILKSAATQNDLDYTAGAPVSLNVPASTSVKAGQYNGTINWTLVSGVANAGTEVSSEN